MKDIELVIRIPEEIYKSSKKECEENDSLIIDTFTYAIGNGTPLPKGHGRLIYADDIALIDEQFYIPSDYYVAESAINDAPTIIEGTEE